MARRRVFLSSVMFVVAAGAAVSGMHGAAAEPSPVHPEAQAQDRTEVAVDRAGDWCRSQGGAVWTYQITRSTGTGRGPVELCVFTGTDDSRIAVGTATLDADAPTQALRAYTRKQPTPPFTGGNPASVYCAALGGTTQNLTDRQGVFGMCVFPDHSMIDEWGLHYHANGIIRGAELTDKFRAR